MSVMIKNVEHETVFSLADKVEVRKGEVVSRTLAQNEAVSLTLFAFDANEEISTHESDGDAMVTVLEGMGKFIVAGREYVLKAGESLVMPSRKPHAVFAQEAFKMLLVVVFPENKSAIVSGR